MTDDVNALGIADEEFLIVSMIERCPKTMMLRELFVNALEAASLAKPNRGQVRIGHELVAGVRKLVIRNNGPGLDATELNRICDLASSLRKTMGLDGNFGMGAKVASLPSNKHGVRYRSCKSGRVNEVVLCQRGGIYGKLRRDLGDGRAVDVLEVTDFCQEAGLETSSDWTEVLLMGNDVRQDTVADPYFGNPVMRADWVEATLRARFYAFPEDVDVILEPLGTRNQTARLLRPFAQKARPGSRTEERRLRSGISLVFRFDPPMPDERAVDQPGPGLACLVHKSEIYDLREGREWIMDAPICGISFAAKFVSVHVLLPDDYPVRPEAYREFLRFQGGDQRKVGIGDFGPAIRASIPQWLEQTIRSFGPRAADYVDEIDGELKDLIRELGLLPTGDNVLTAAILLGNDNPATANDPDNAAAKEDDRPPSPPPGYAAPPEIIAFSDKEEVAERGLTDRVARYYVETNHLFINLNYSAIKRLSDCLQKDFAYQGLPPEELAEYADTTAEWACVRKVARATIYCLSKRKEKWSTEAIDRALSSESLSIAADDHDALDECRKRMQDQIGRPVAYAELATLS